MIKLLLVEDDANLCYIIRGGLEDMIGGYEVMTASNGEEGLKIWKEQHLDIIISDIEMPVMDGYEMVRRIRETDGFIPIVFTSGRVSPKDVVKGYELGVNNYIKKPFVAEELDAHIGALSRILCPHPPSTRRFNAPSNEVWMSRLWFLLPPTSRLLRTPPSTNFTN